jgi:hypothetical protein
MAADSSWLAPTVEQRPAPEPRRAALPPGVRRAVPVGGVADPEPEPFPPTPPTPPPLTEAQARALLAERQQAMRDAASTSDAAQAALARAQQHVEDRTAALKEFDALDSDVTALHVQALRDGDGRHVELPAELRARITARDEAAVALDGATAAMPVFEREAQVARDVASSARIAVSAIADQLVARHAVALLARRNEVAAELEKLDASVLSFEQFAKPVPRRIAEFALETYASGRTRVALLNTAPWRALHDRLATDPAAELTLTP